MLVWVNPITDGRDRSVLDALLREASAAGVWVSAHPDVIDVLGTKEVLYRTRGLGCGSDVRLYDDVLAFRAELPGRLGAGPRVLKRVRGNGGLGVWKLELVAPGSTTVHVQHAHDGAVEVLALDDALNRFAPYLAGGGRLVEQPFVPRSTEGMVRCYLSGDRVVGFSEHVARGFLPPRRVARLREGATEFRQNDVRPRGGRVLRAPYSGRDGLVTGAATRAAAGQGNAPGDLGRRFSSWGRRRNRRGHVGALRDQRQLRVPVPG